MRQPGRRSGNVRYGSGCAARVRHLQVGRVSHRQAPVLASAFVEDAPARALMAIQMELARALRQLLWASGECEACKVVVQNPILLVESASELLRAMMEEAERCGNADDQEMLTSYLQVLELARETRMVTSSDADQPG